MSRAEARALVGFCGQLPVGLCGLEAGGRWLTFSSRGQVRVLVLNFRVRVMREARMIIGKSGAGASNGHGKVWEITKAVANRKREGVSGGNFSQNVFQDALAPRDVYLYIIYDGKVSWTHTGFKVKQVFLL